MNKVTTLLVLMILLGCSEPNISLPEGNPVLVVEGWVTDQATRHWVKISKTTGFNDNKPESIISDAIVIIEHQNNVSEELTFDVTTGQYLSNTFAGIPDDSYRVHITLSDGTNLLSEWEVLNHVALIDDLDFESFDDKDPISGEDIVVYYPNVESQDPVDEQNQYRYKGYKNGALLNAPEELVLLSDEFNNGQILNHYIPEFRLSLNDQFIIELHSLSSPAFRFLTLLKAQTTSLGSSSGTAPVKLVGNLSYTNRPDDIILGFFGASGVKKISKQVSE